LKFKNQKALEALGFKEGWLKPLNYWGLNALETGVYTNQNFGYECLYKELKKILNVGYVDC